jgi:hypothetical protein
MNKQILVGGTILMLAAKSALGQDNQSDLYRANEFSAEGFGSASLGKYSLDHISGQRVRENTRLGAGAGLNYFFTKYIGISAEAYSENIKGPFVDSTSANLTLRLPLGQSGFAPYAFGGAGRDFDPAKFWFGQVGGGIEYRFSPNIGIFTDGRFVEPQHTKYFGVARLGLRFAF